jgi:hypothetical protein
MARKANVKKVKPIIEEAIRFVCRAKDLVEVARKITETYEAFENRHKSGP